MANKSLLTAKASKNDEFYTQYDDIAAELKHYSTFLRGKVVFCNCDDPTSSGRAATHNFHLRICLRPEL